MSDPGTAAPTYRAFSVEHAEHVAHVTLLGPGKGNALGPDFWREAPLVFGALDRDERVRAIVLGGSADTFTFGLDLPAMTGQIRGVLGDAPLAAERTRLLDMLGDMQRGVRALLECRKPVIAAISGWCVGAGIDLICAADVRVASREAMFSVRAVRIGIVEDMGSLQRLPAIVGEGAARELALTGDDFDAARAAAIRLVDHVEETPAGAREHATAIAHRIAANPPLTVQGVKQVMNAHALDRIADGLRHTALWNAAFLPSHDFAEAMRAFMEKRPPSFEGR